MRGLRAEPVGSPPGYPPSRLLSRSRCRFGYGLGWAELSPKEPCVRSGLGASQEEALLGEHT